MSYGPVEYVVLKFPGNQFSGEIAPALHELVNTGTVRIIDLLFAIKDADGTVGVFELNGMGDSVTAIFEPVDATADELLSESDAQHVAALLEPNSSAALLLFENTWATRFAEAVSNANGEVIVNARIPRDVIEELVSESMSA
jgi:uncharacterized membrane protein